MNFVDGPQKVNCICTLDITLYYDQGVAKVTERRRGEGGREQNVFQGSCVKVSHTFWPGFYLLVLYPFTPTVIKFKVLLHSPKQYYITQHEELGFS